MQLQNLNTTRLKVCIEALKPFPITRFPSSAPNQPGEKKRGRPRIAPLWLLVALAVLKHSWDITWRQYAQALQTPQATAVLKRYGAIKSPSKSTLHNAWDNALIDPLRDMLIEMGWKIAKEPKTLAIDSIGFEMKAGSTWRLLKWDKSFLKKASKWFEKAHILADTATQAVLSSALPSPSTTT